MASKGESPSTCPDHGDQASLSTSVDAPPPLESATMHNSREVTHNVDPELDAILDSALADFDKQKESPARKPDLTGAVGGPADSQKQQADAHAKKEGIPDTDAGPSEELNYDFLSDAMNKQFEDTFKTLMNDPNLKKQFEDLADSAEDAASSNNVAAFTETVEKALSGLNLNAENLQGDPNQQEMWEQLAETLGSEGVRSMGGPGEGLDAMGGMFQNMIKQLLSKELLYQPLQEVIVKYKEYLEANQQTLEAEKLQMYRKQLEIVEKVVEHLDGDSESHSVEEKNARFEILLDLLQQMHELGQPPVEVVGESNAMLPNLSDLTGMGQLPGMGNLGGAGQDPSQCRLM